MNRPSPASRLRSWLGWVFLAGLAGFSLFGVLVYSAMEVFASLNADQPAALHSALHANYGMDDHPLLIPALNIGLVGEAMRDQQIGTPLSTQYIATVIG